MFVYRVFRTQQYIYGLRSPSDHTSSRPGCLGCFACGMMLPTYVVSFYAISTSSLHVLPVVSSRSTHTCVLLFLTFSLIILHAHLLARSRTLPQVSFCRVFSFITIYYLIPDWQSSVATCFTAYTPRYVLYYTVHFPSSISFSHPHAFPAFPSRIIAT